MSVSAIFNSMGESYFREQEHRLLKHFAHKKNIILSCGGGVIKDETNRRLLSGLHTVLLAVSPEISLKRIRDKDRPLLNVQDPLQVARKIWQDRKKHYLQSAHVMVNAESHSARELAQLVWHDYCETWL
jgi:shikimate kinase